MVSAIILVDIMCLNAFSIHFRMLFSKTDLFLYVFDSDFISNFAFSLTTFHADFPAMKKVNTNLGTARVYKLLKTGKYDRNVNTG